jgi:hypothetical protein
MTICIKQTQHTVLAAGEYLAEVSAIEQVDGQFGPQLKISFALLGEHEGAKLTGWCSKSFNVKSKLYEWTLAIMGGKPIPPDWDFESDALMSRKVMLTVVKRAGTNGEEFNKIDSLAPAKATPKPKPVLVAAPMLEADPWPEDDAPY